MTAVTALEAILEPPAELLSFAQRQVRNARSHRDAERRSEERELLVVPVLVTPVDEAFRAVGSRFTVVTRDISRHGIGLVHLERINHRLLAIQTHLANEEVTLVAEVVWQKPMGPFENIGCKIVARLKEFPEENRPSDWDAPACP